MNIKKGPLLFLVIVNCLLIVSTIAQFAFAHNYLLSSKGITNHQLAYRSIWVNGPSAICSIIIHIGLFWLIRKLREAKWLISGVVVFFLLRLIAIIVVPLSVYTTGNLHNVFLISRSLLISSDLYMAFTFFFVRNLTARNYYRLFAIILITLQTISILSYAIPPSLFRYSTLLNCIPFVVSLMLFVSFYNQPAYSEEFVEPEYVRPVGFEDFDVEE